MSTIASKEQRASFEEQICGRQAENYASERAMRAILLRRDSDGHYIDERVQWAWDAYLASHKELGADMTKKRAALFRMQIAMGSASKRLCSSEDCSDIPAKLMAEAKDAAAARGAYATPEVEIVARTMYLQWLDLAKPTTHVPFDVLASAQQDQWRTKAADLLDRVLKIADKMSETANTEAS